MFYREACESYLSKPKFEQNFPKVIWNEFLLKSFENNYNFEKL